MNHYYYILMLIILESIAISLLKYSSKNNNKFYILSGICYLLIVYIELWVIVIVNKLLQYILQGVPLNRDTICIYIL